LQKKKGRDRGAGEVKETRKAISQELEKTELKVA